MVLKSIVLATVLFLSALNLGYASLTSAQHFQSEQSAQP
jgi:hypothetical protein